LAATFGIGSGTCGTERSPSTLSGDGSKAIRGNVERARTWGGSGNGRSGAILSELLDEVAGKSLQIEVPAVRLLFELLRFLLKVVVSLWPSRLVRKTSSFLNRSVFFPQPADFEQFRG
jgi:hypothetical protein